LVEQLTLNQRVVGSNPTSPTTSFNNIKLLTWLTAQPSGHVGTYRLL
jgi:citrate lyase synthetase